MAYLPSGLSYDSPNVTIKGFNPPPGPQNPGKYPQVGPAYQHWGEVNGYVYDPFRDQYSPDPVKQQQYYQNSGLSPKPPKQPSALAGIGTIAAGAGATALGYQAFKDPAGLINSVKAIPNAIGLGSTTSGATNAGAASAGGAGAAPAASPGLLGVGQAGAAPGVPSLLSAAPGVPSVIGADLTAPAGAAAPAIQAGESTLGAYSGTPIVGSNAVAGATPVAPSGFALSGIGGAGNFVLPAAGAAGAFDVLSHNYGPGRSALEGAASGAAIGSYFGPVGAAVGGAAGGLIGLGKSVLFKDEDKWKTEKNKLTKLSESGAYIPPGLIESMPTKGRKLKDLIRQDMPADFVGRDPQGNWVNNKFATTRDVKDLQGTDIVNYSAFAQNDPQWFTKPLDQRIAIANQALAAGAVKEHHGTIDVAFDKFTPGAAPAPAPGQPAPTGAPPPKGTRLSPGVYADGRGGSTRR